MNFQDLVSKLSNQTVTGGWDAVFAVDAAQINALFFQQYLQNGPTSPAVPLRTVAQNGTDFWVLDLTLGPPEIAFSSNFSAEQAQVSMFIVGGQFIQFDPISQTVIAALSLAPNQSSLSGVLSLTNVTGEVNQLGAVAVDLGSNAYQPQITGIPTNSVLATEIGLAVQTFFANNRTQYPLGTISESDISAVLQPTQFRFVTQANPDVADDGAVLLLIQTTGSGGTPSPLSVYPIPDDAGVALIVSNSVMFNNLIGDALTPEFSNFNGTFAGQQSGGLWQTVATGGAISAGPYEVMSSFNDNTPYTSDDRTNKTPVSFPLAGMTVVPNQGAITVNLDTTWTQYYTIIGGHSQFEAVTSQLQATYNLTATPTVDSTTDIVSFSGNGTPQIVDPDPPGWFKKFFSADSPFPEQMVLDIQPTLEKIFSNFELPSVNTFALSNILFPSQHIANYQNVSVPGDLLLAGQLSQPVSVSPATATVSPGGTQSFTASSGGQNLNNVTWELTPNIGSIDANGNYTAPLTISRPLVVVVTAINSDNTQQTGSAMIQLFEPPPQTGLLISPPELLLTAGQTFSLQITDSSGNDIDATVTLSPNVGTLSQGFTTGAWIYTAPTGVTSPTVVTLTASGTTDPSQTGTVTIEVLSSDQVTLSPASTTVAPGGTLNFSAASVFEDLLWFVSPISGGTITPNPSDPTQATFTASASAQTGELVVVIALGLADAAGVGLARVTIGGS
jgi:hypothetical protein